MDNCPLPTVPSPIRVNTGDEELIEQMQENFFEDILRFLGVTSDRAKQAWVDNKRQMIADSDDQLHSLYVRDHLVATVIRYRDVMNFVQAKFALYLDEQTLRRTMFVNGQPPRRNLDR